MKAVAHTLGVSRSNLHERVSGKTKPRRRYHKAQDAVLLPLIERLVATCPTYGYRRITAALNRKRRTHGLAPANHTILKSRVSIGEPDRVRTCDLLIKSSLSSVAQQ